jgi:hypothetical protein
MQNQRAGTDLRLPRRRIGIDPEVIVETPATHCFANRKYLGAQLVLADL